MKRLTPGALLFAILLALSLFAPPLGAQQTTSACPGIGVPLRPAGFEQLTITTTASGLTAATASGKWMAVAVLEQQPIRYRDDGTNPTATVGSIITATSTAPQAFVICGASLTAIRFIRDTTATANATLDVNYYAP